MLKKYDKSELLNKLGKLSIERNGDTIITKLDSRVIKTSIVTKVYEVFDIVSYIKEKIDLIENSFEIKQYELILKGGMQYLKLVSDSVQVGDMELHKSFYIVNSTDKSRRLSFNLGLYSDRRNIHYINSYKELDFCKKHYNGINDKVNEKFGKIDKEVFADQIESLRDLVGHQIKLSNVKKVIMGEKEVFSKSDTNRFLAFKNGVINYGLITLESEERYELRRKTTEVQNDFYLDAIGVLFSYLRVFNNQDSSILKRESKRILELTKFTIRRNRINSILEHS